MSNNNKKIQKVTLLKVKDGYGLKVIFKETDSSGDPSRDDKESRGLIHPDLRAAMDALKVHWGLLSGLIKVDDVADIILPEHKLLEKIHVNGVSIGGDEEENTHGVILSGHYLTWRAKAQSLNTPFERFEGSPEARYLYMDDLAAKISVLEDEVQKYLTGKRGAKPAAEPKEVDKNQGNLFDEKATAEGNLVKGADRDKYANKDAMERVAELGTEDAGGKKSDKRRSRKASANGQEDQPATE